MPEETPLGGDKGGEAGFSGRLRDRLDRLLTDPKSPAREIGTITRALLGARKLDLIERQIALAERKLTGGGADLAGLVAEAEHRATDRKLKREADQPPGGLP